MKQTGWLLIAGGIALVLTGVGLLLAGRIPFVGRLPGDIHIEGRQVAFSFPMMTCLVVSLILTLLLNVLLRFFHK